MKRIIVAIGIIAIALSCSKEDLAWDLPRINELDSLQNTNPNGSQIPLAKFVVSNSSIPIGSSVTFVSTSTQNPNYIEWNFEGGSPISSLESSPVVTYNQIGKYDVRLMVSNGFGSDSIIKVDFIEAYYQKLFDNGQWDGWINDGWLFSSSQNCEGCIFAWQNSSSNPITYSIDKDFTNIPSNCALEFFFYVYSPSGTLRVKVNGAEIWNNSGYGSNIAHIPLPSLSNFNLSIEATVGYTQSIYLNDIKIRPL